MTMPEDNPPAALTPAPLSKPVRGHLPELDALRGIAAIIVVLGHYRTTWYETIHPHWLVAVPSKAPVWFFFNGTASVQVFFLLSGFVLALPSIANRAQPFPVYAIRRVCRIYLPYLGALALAVLGCWIFSGRQGYATEVNFLWRNKPDLQSVADHILFVGRYNAYRYNPPTWSLVQEMRISLMFPLLCWLALKLPSWVGLTVSALLPAVASLAFLYGPARYFGNFSSPGEYRVSFVNTLGYCGTFILGALVAKHQDVIRSRFDAMPIFVHLPIFVAAMRLYLYPPNLPYNLMEFVEAIGGLYLVLAALSARGYFARALRTAALQFAGRVSYSLYLIHMTVLMLMCVVIPGKVSFGLLLVPYLAVTLALSAVMYRWVEQPSIALGKAIAGRLLSRRSHQA